MDLQKFRNNEDDANRPPAYMTVREMPTRRRPREEMDRVGIVNIDDEAVLAILLRSGIKGKNVIDLARDLMTRYRSFSEMAKASVEELAAVPGMGRVKAQILSAALDLSRRIRTEDVHKKFPVRSPADVAMLLGDEAHALDHEKFWVLLLDTKNRLKIPPENISKGLLDASLVHPREVFRKAIASSTSAVILAHNHPSGDTTPSPDDMRITRQLVEAGKIIDIKVLDHIILSGRADNKQAGYFSMRESGAMKFG